MKKRLITVTDIKNYLQTGQKIIYLEPGTIITPAARDAAAEFGLTVKTGAGPAEAEACRSQTCSEGTGFAAKAVKEAGSAGKFNGVDPELIAQIVREVMASLSGLQQETGLVKESDPSGVRLVRGKSVECEPFNTGNPQDKVGIKEILTTKESPNMATGFMTIEETAFSWDLKYEEIDYIVDGTLEITINGKTYTGKAGDVFYLPSNTTVTFSSPDKAKFFFVTYPANWAELSNYQN